MTLSTKPLTFMQVKALKDCWSFQKQGSAYFWMPKTMEKLVALGLAEEFNETGFITWRLTPEGIKIAKGES